MRKTRASKVSDWGGRGPVCCLARRLALRSSESASGSSCLPRCRRAHTTAKVLQPPDACTAGSTARQPRPSASRPVLGHLTVGCTARRTRGATTAPRSRPHATLRTAIVTPVPTSRAKGACCAGRPFSGQRCGCHACTTGTDHAQRSSTANVSQSPQLHRPFHSGPRPRAVALFELRRLDARCCGGQRHPRVKLITCRHQAPSWRSFRASASTTPPATENAAAASH